MRLICQPRTLVGRVNRSATRHRELVQIKKGRAKVTPVKGRGRYKSFTARAMLKSVLLGVYVATHTHNSIITAQYKYDMINMII